MEPASSVGFPAHMTSMPNFGAEATCQSKNELGTHNFHTNPHDSPSEKKTSCWFYRFSFPIWIQNWDLEYIRCIYLYIIKKAGLWPLWRNKAAWGLMNQNAMRVREQQSLIASFFSRRQQKFIHSSDSSAEACHILISSRRIPSKCPSLRRRKPWRQLMSLDKPCSETVVLKPSYAEQIEGDDCTAGVCSIDLSPFALKPLWTKPWVQQIWNLYFVRNHPWVHFMKQKGVCQEFIVYRPSHLLCINHLPNINFKPLPARLLPNVQTLSDLETRKEIESNLKFENMNLWKVNAPKKHVTQEIFIGS